MATIDNNLSNLNANHTQITDLIPNIYPFTDEWSYAIDEFEVNGDVPPLGNFLYRDSSNKLLWCGISGGEGGNYNIRRFNSNYSLDESFNPPSCDSSGNNGFVRQVGQQSNGKYIVVGHFQNVNSGTTVNRIMRLNTDGTLDTTFNDGGSGFDNHAICLKILSNDKILVGGSFDNYNFSSCERVIKLNADGSVDGSFTPPSFSSDVLCLEVASNGDIYVGGGFSDGITRLNSDGTTDGGFDVGGGFDDIVSSIKIDSNGKILVGGWFTQYKSNPALKVCRLLNNGILDDTFTVDGTGFSFYDGSNGVQHLAIQSNGKILVGGWFDELDGNRQTKLVRLNTDGSKDSTFDIGKGFNFLADFHGGSRVQHILINNDGSILVTGSIYAYQDMNINGFAKLSSTGGLDESVQLIKYAVTFGISDGSYDMYDGGNFMNTNLTQLYSEIQGDNVNSSLSIPNTHQPAADNDSFEENNSSEPTAFAYSPRSTSEVKSGTDYFGSGSSYFTAMYPGMFVMVARDIDITEFSIGGDLGSDEDTDLEVGLASLFDPQGNTYSCFMKTNIEDGGNDPTVNHIILVPGTSEGLTHLTNSDGDSYDDDCVQGLEGRDHIYYILFSTYTDPAEMVSFETCQAVAEKFLEIIGQEEAVEVFGCNTTCTDNQLVGFGCKKTTTACTCAKMRYFYPGCKDPNSPLCFGRQGAFVPAITVCNQRLQ